MTTPTFEIIDGVYAGPGVYPWDLDLRPYKDILISLGSLEEVRGDLDVNGCTSLVSLGSLTEIKGMLDLEGCTSLTSLGSLTKVGGWTCLNGCASLTSLGSLKEVEESLYLCDCTSLTSLGSLQKVGETIILEEGYTPLHEVLEKIYYYSSLLAHEALNALHTEEVQSVPLYKNILLKSLQGEGISSL